MRQLRPLAPAAVLVLALAGCGGDDSDGTDDGTGDEAPDTPTSSATVETTETEATDPDTDGGDAGGCLVSDDEVAGATGVEATAVDNSVTGTTICSWSSTTGDNVTVTVKTETGTFDATLAATEDVIGPAEPLPGVGDEAAIFASDVLSQAGVLAQAGDQLVSVILTSTDRDEEAVRSGVTELATVVVDRL